MELRRYALAAEAAAALIAARAGLLVVPFRRLAAWTTRPVIAGTSSDRDRTRAIADVRWAIAVAAARLPGSTTCLPRALASQAMLGRRGVGTTLTYGVRSGDAALDAHAWLTAGAEGVVGHELAPCYAVMACYSNQCLDHSLLSHRQT